MVIYSRWVVLLTFIYLALTSSFALSNIVVGIVLAVAAVALVRPTPRPTSPRNVPRTIVTIVRYLINLVADLIVSGVQVARIVVSPSLPIRPGIIAIPAETTTDRGLALSAHAVTLTPGEIVVEIDDDHVMYTHCLDATRGEAHIMEALKIQHELLDDIFP